MQHCSYRLCMKVSDLVHQFLQLEPQKSSARLTFYHFFKNFYSLQTELTPNLIDEFYDRALYFQYWQENKKSLGQQIKLDWDRMTFKGKVAFDPLAVAHCHELQLLQIEHTKDFHELIKKAKESETGKGDKTQILPIENSKEIMSLQLKSNGELIVEIWRPTALIYRGQLQLLTPATRLEYTEKMELKDKVSQWVTYDGLFIAHFQQLNSNIHGTISQGHHFQKHETLSAPLHKYTELFYAIKGLECLFIHSPSDPFYQEITLLLEKSIELLSQNHPEATLIGNQALKKGQLACKKVFPNDKLLKVLVTKLKYLLESSGAVVSDSDPNQNQGGKTWRNQKAETIKPLI